MGADEPVSDEPVSDKPVSDERRSEHPLFDPSRVPDVDPRDAVRVVHAFLERCAAWAQDRELPERLRRMTAEPTPEHAAKLHQWSTWLAFVRHTQRELEDGTLDRWFHPDP